MGEALLDLDEGMKVGDKVVNAVRLTDDKTFVSSTEEFSWDSKGLRNECKSA